jgi:hypothetical protein
LGLGRCAVVSLGEFAVLWSAAVKLVNRVQVIASKKQGYVVSL